MNTLVWAMTAPEPFEAVFGYVVSVEGSEAGDRCYRAVIAYANAASYDPTGNCIVWVDKPALQSLLQTALVTGNLLFFEGIKFYDAALPGVAQFHTFARLTVYNSAQGPLVGNHPRIDLPPH
jgi:hypothetical protein